MREFYGFVLVLLLIAFFGTLGDSQWIAVGVLAVAMLVVGWRFEAHGSASTRGPR